MVKLLRKTLAFSTEIVAWNFSRHTDSRFIQDPGCKLAAKKETYSSLPHKSLAWSEISINFALAE